MNKYKEDSKEMNEALKRCDSEPIHTPGHLQDFGCLIAFNELSSNINYVSKNISDFLNIEAEEALQLKIHDVFDSDICQAIALTIKEKNIEKHREHVVFHKDKKDLQLSIYKHVNDIVIELIPYTRNVENFAESLGEIRWLLSNVSAFKSVNEILELAVKQLRKINGFDIVMAYRFIPDGAGDVVAESKGDTDKTFLGLRFPAYDIPPRARDIFLRTPIRIIKDVAKGNTPILANIDKPLDMTLSVLRGTSPVHLEYLNNMGVKSSMTLPIVVDGKLWGLFASHNYRQTKLNSETISAYELAGKLLSLVIEYSINLHAEQQRIKLLKISEDLSIEETKSVDLEDFWAFILNKFCGLLRSHGFTYSVNNTLNFEGNCPNVGDCLSIINHASRVMQGKEEVAIENLSEVFPDMKLGNIAGCLYFSISESNPKVDLIFFRDEISKKVLWAGNPEKNLEKDKVGSRLTPRESFKEYVENIKGHCEPWEDEDISIARNINSALVKNLWKLKKMTDLNTKLERNNQDLNQFAYIASHDLRSPLRAIKYLSRAIADDEENKLSAESSESLKLLNSRANRLEALLDALLDYHKAGNESQELVLCDTKLLIKDIFNNLFESNKAELILGELPSIETKEVPLKIVFSNILDNALKYNDKNKAIIKIGFTEFDSQYHFYVEDNGPGIEKKYYDKVFKMFTTLQSRDEVESSGIGLSVIEKVLEGQDCSIWITAAAEGSGCRFNFSWPKFKT